MEKEKKDNGTKGAMSLHLSGDIYIIRGEYDKALEYYQKSLADTEEKCGKDHHITYIDLSNIGKVYVHMEKYDKALEYYQKALVQRLKEPHKGKYPDPTAYIYDDIGNAYSNLGENEKALAAYTKIQPYFFAKNTVMKYYSLYKNNCSDIIQMQGQFFNDCSKDWYFIAFYIKFLLTYQ